MSRLVDLLLEGLTGKTALERAAAQERSERERKAAVELAEGRKREQQKAEYDARLRVKVDKLDRKLWRKLAPHMRDLTELHELIVRHGMKPKDDIPGLGKGWTIVKARVRYQESETSHDLDRIGPVTSYRNAYRNIPICILADGSVAVEPTVWFPGEREGHQYRKLKGPYVRITPTTIQHLDVISLSDLRSGIVTFMLDNGLT